MSSILKALKRLEEDKAERLDVPADIGRDILRQPRRQRRSEPLPALNLIVAASLVVAAVLFTLIVWKSFNVPDIAAVSESAVVAPSSAPPKLAADSPSRPAAYREPDVVEVRMAEPPPAVAPKPAAISTTLPAAQPAEAASAKTRELAPEEKPAAPAVVQPAARPHLVVSGIVFQPDRQARLAVVNDLPVMEGTVIEGATVEEILADRVRFTWNGRTVEVQLGASE